MVHLKDFEEYVATRLTSEERAAIKKEVEAEFAIYDTMQNFISSMIEEYMEQHNFEYDDMAKLLHVSKARVIKIKNKQVNMRIFDLVRLMAVLGKDLDDLFNLKKQR